MDNTPRLKSEETLHSISFSNCRYSETELRIFRTGILQWRKSESSILEKTEVLCSVFHFQQLSAIHESEGTGRTHHVQSHAIYQI